MLRHLKYGRAAAECQVRHHCTVGHEVIYPLKPEVEDVHGTRNSVGETGRYISEGSLQAEVFNKVITQPQADHRPGCQTFRAVKCIPAHVRGDSNRTGPLPGMDSSR